MNGLRFSTRSTPLQQHAARRMQVIRTIRSPVTSAQLSTLSGNRPQPPSAQTDDMHAPAQGPPQRVFMFNPNDPNSMEEMMISPHEDVDAAEELLARAQGDVQNEAGGNQPRRPTPIPLRAVSPMPSRGRYRPAMAAPGSGAPFMASDSQALTVGSNQNEQISRSTEMQKQLMKQLEKEQSQVAHLTQYENMYREWRMKAERLDSDIGLLQRLVAEKDAELSHGYKLLESSAAERSRLRHSYQAAQEKSKQLQLKLAEAQSRALAAPSSPALLGSGGAAQEGQASGTGRPRTAQMGSIEGLIEELSVLAKGMANEMSQEVRTMVSASTHE